MNVSVAGILYRCGEVFVARRLNEGSMGGRWEFPGGKAEEGENPQQALRREFDEEFGSAITVGEFLGSAEFVHKKQVRDLFAYRIFTEEDPLVWPLREHGETRWIPLAEIPRLFFVDSDLLLLPELLKWEKSLL